MNLVKPLQVLSIFILIVSIFLSFFIYPRLPETVPIHWNAMGEIDGYGPSWVAAFLFPVLMFFILIFFFVIPKIDVFKRNLEKSAKPYWFLSFILQLFFLFFFTITILPNFGVSFSIVFFLLPVSFLLIVIGLLLPSFKRNFFVGIRTPWTLSNDLVWKKTHKFGGKLFILEGVIIIENFG